MAYKGAMGVSTLGVKFAWSPVNTTEGNYDKIPTTFYQLDRTNAIGGISLEPETIDASALEDYITKSVSGRSTGGEKVAITVNVTDDTITEWENVFKASEAAIAAQHGDIWFQVWSPSHAKAFFFRGQTPSDFPMPEYSQNALETVEIQLTISDYKGLNTKTTISDNSAYVAPTSGT